MNYQQAIDFLYSQLPMFSRVGSAAFKKDLTNTLLLCQYLDKPQEKFRSIHVGGTNGKGSVSHMLAAILQEAGLTTGLYTSPHLYDFRERIKVNGAMIEEAFVMQFVERMKEEMEKVQPSFFELTVAMAFEYFSVKKVDIAIIEVGLGGRLDSTNVITPVLSVITNIGWDHMNLLGTTLPEIASEKAGIIKKEVPVVIGERQPETDGVFQQAAMAQGADILFAEDRFRATKHQWNGGYLEVDVLDKKNNSTASYTLDLPGLYQKKNLCTVLQSVEVLKGKGILPANTKVEASLLQVKKLTGLSGRWEIISQHPQVILEVAHNVNGIREMLNHINEISFRKLHLILGFVRDKEVMKVLGLLPREADYYFTQAHIPRALDAATLKEFATPAGLRGETFDDVNSALAAARASAAENDLVIVCGSIFLVAEVNRPVLKL
jgi:dihydrofolate synthase/folylpolyglutamate synthase